MNGTSSSRPVVFDLLVIAGGIVTTIVTLGGVYLLAARDSDFEVMGWYAFFVIPAGAILVGIAAGSGYGLLSWLTGRKVGGGLLITVAVLLVGAYGGAQWLEFASLGLINESGEPISFVDYYDAVTRSMELSFSRSKSSTGELGVFGYLFRLLELAGFTAGGLVVPLVLRTKPYCERCSTYMRTRSLGFVPAAAPTRKIKRGDTTAMAAYEQEMQTALETGGEEASAAMQAAGNRDASALMSVLEKYAAKRKEIAKLLHRFELTLSSCPRCHDGTVVCKLHSGLGDKTNTQVVGAQEVPATFTRMLRPA